MPRPKTFAPELAEQGPIVDDEVGRLFASTQAQGAQPRVRSLPPERIDPNPFQARQTFPDLDELAQTIRVQGFTSRLRVRPHPDDPTRFQLVYGERRLRAAALAGLTQVPVEIVACSDDELIEVGLAENLQRHDLTPLEEAQGLQVLMERRGYSQRVVAERLGKTPGYIQNRLDLLRAPPDVQHLVLARPDSLNAARSLARLPDEGLRQPLIAALLAGTLSGDAVALRVRDLLDRANAPAVAPMARANASSGDDAESSPHGAGAQSARVVKAGSTGRTAAAPSEVSSSPLVRMLEADTERVEVLLAKWRQALARASADDCRAFAAYLRDRLEPQLALLRETAERE